MPPKPQSRRPPSSTPPDSLPPDSDPLPGDLRREDQQAIASDELPDAGEDLEPEAAQGVHSPSIDGGVAQHPVHDEPEEDFTPADYEEQIEDVAESRRNQSKRATADEP